MTSRFLTSSPLCFFFIVYQLNLLICGQGYDIHVKWRDLFETYVDNCELRVASVKVLFGTF